MKQTYLIENIIIPFEPGKDESYFNEIAFQKAELLLRKSNINDFSGFSVYRRSIDCRRRNNIKFVFSLTFSCEIGDIYLKDIKKYDESDIKPIIGNLSADKPVVIVGFGPAGMFCSMLLAEYGYNPIVFERGGDIDSRIKSVDSFIKTGILNSESNIQFGAGGAGAFSDGKLTTRINDSLCRYILKKFVKFGAPADILTKSKPHIGSDVLRIVISNIDNYIKSKGGTINYNSKIKFRGSNIYLNSEKIDYSSLVIAIGHSARDSYYEMLDSGYNIIPKSYSVGFRIEHLREDIDYSVFGRFAGDSVLGAAEYNMSYREGSRGVYTFCMCPGGIVVPSSSENETIVTNGMSYRSRNEINSNSAIAISVLPEDYGNNPVGAIKYQEKFEKSAFAAGKGNFRAPCQTVSGYFNDKVIYPSKVTPSYMNGNVNYSNLNSIFPYSYNELFKTGITKFNNTISCFNDENAVLTGVETRTSSPVRIIRNDNMTTGPDNSIFPCGEGAGYAGGIMSAAVDGLKTALKIMEKYSPSEK